MPRVDNTYRWYALYTIANHEKIVNDFLTRIGIESFLPLTRTLKQWSDRKRWVEVPLFPSYVFVRVSCLEYYSALSHQSALKYVCFEGVAEPIKDQQIESLKQVIQNKLKYELISTRFLPGQKLTINYEPFYGYEVELIKYKGHKKVLLRIDNIGYFIILDAPLVYLKDAELAHSQNYGFAST